MRIILPYKCSKFDVEFRIREKINKIFQVLEKAAFELISLNTHFYREKLLVIGSQYVNKQSQDFRYY